MPRNWVYIPGEVWPEQNSADYPTKRFPTTTVWVQKRGTVILKTKDWHFSIKVPVTEMASSGTLTRSWLQPPSPWKQHMVSHVYKSSNSCHFQKANKRWLLYCWGKRSSHTAGGLAVVELLGPVHEPCRLAKEMAIRVLNSIFVLFPELQIKPVLFTGFFLIW